jgi:GNAT superfamily N-acetyltransferase
MTRVATDLKALRVVPARADDLDRYLDLLEGVANWLESRGTPQWRPGTFREASAFYASSITRGEVQLAFLGDTLAGTLRLVLQEPIVWPDVREDEAVYIYNLAVAREFAHRDLGRRLLDWAADKAVRLGRTFVRLDCVSDNHFLRDYYTLCGFDEHGEVEATFPPPVGTLRLQRYEKRVGVD